MLGIDVGAAEVTRSDGSRFHHRTAETPSDLLGRVPDEVPYVVVGEDGCQVRPAHEIYAAAVASAVRGHDMAASADVMSLAPPVGVAVPGWWTPRTVARVRTALTAEGLDVLVVNDAEAAVLEHRDSGHRVPDTLAVVSLRAEQVSSVIVEHCQDRPTALQSPALVHSEGGNRLDVAVLRHLVGGLTDLGDQIDLDDPATIVAARGALAQCREVREALSISAVESVRPDLPGAGHQLRLVRSELEELADPWADAVVSMVGTTIEHYAKPVDAVLLVGGVAAMPLITQRLSADLDREVVVVDEPAFGVARGARRFLANETLWSQPEPSATVFSSLAAWWRTRVYPRRVTAKRHRRLDAPTGQLAAGAVRARPATATLADIAPGLFADQPVATRPLGDDAADRQLAH